jgi:CheY-like chemotaxis protein
MGPLRILLVEDDPDIADVLVFLLQRAGYEVEHAGNGALALRCLEGSSPDLVITDVTMPVMDGMAMVLAIRKSKRLCGLPMLVLSSLSEAQVREECEGMYMFLPKPFKTRELLDTLETLLAVKAAFPGRLPPPQPRNLSGCRS